MTDQNDLGGPGTPTSPWAWVPKDENTSEPLAASASGPPSPVPNGGAPGPGPGSFPPVTWVTAPPAPIVPPPTGAVAPNAEPPRDVPMAGATPDGAVAPMDVPESPAGVTSPNLAAGAPVADASAPEPAVADPPLPTVLPEVATVPVPYADEPVAAPPMPMDPIFRDSEQTRIDAVTDEERKLAAERAARREARIRALSAPEPDVAVAVPPPVVVTQRSTDKFIPSLGLLVLRIVTAGIFGLRGFALLANKGQAETVLRGTVLPQPEIWVFVAGIASMAVALGLLLGLLTRIAGLGATLIAGGVLAFVMWGPAWSPFDTSATGFLGGQYAFLGEFELLAAVAGFVLLCVGGGGISIDRAFRASRQGNKTQ